MADKTNNTTNTFNPQEEPRGRVGCTDRNAKNYDSTATTPCSSCCIMGNRSVVGCTDPVASNYNSDATVDCDGCCEYETFINIWDDGTTYGERKPFIPTYPYQVDVDASTCITNTDFNRNWLDTNIRYSDGFDRYQESLSNITQTAPNYENKPLSVIWDAFDRLLELKPNFRVFINNTNLTPWIIPSSAESFRTNRPNPNTSQFRSDCASVGGVVFKYDPNTSRINNPYNRPYQSQTAPNGVAPNNTSYGDYSYTPPNNDEFRNIRTPYNYTPPSTDGFYACLCETTDDTIDTTTVDSGTNECTYVATNNETYKLS
jgi:hypothetical protein